MFFNILYKHKKNSRRNDRNPYRSTRITRNRNNRNRDHNHDRNRNLEHWGR